METKPPTVRDLLETTTAGTCYLTSLEIYWDLAVARPHDPLNHVAQILRRSINGILSTPGPEASTATAVRPGYMDISEPWVTEFGVFTPKAPVLYGPYADAVRAGQKLSNVLRQSDEQNDDIDQVLSDLFREPWYKRLWNWLLATQAYQRPLSDRDLQDISESLDRALQLPMYKRIPSLITWLWRLP
jgi:hypothetical protein